jgi:hypothetical protein
LMGHSTEFPTLATVRSTWFKRILGSRKRLNDGGRLTLVSGAPSRLVRNLFGGAHCSTKE